MSVYVAMIAAVAENGVIGYGNAIPWHLPSDFAHFKRMTWGKPLIMGRRTFEGIGRPLPGRTTIVVSRQPGYRADGVTTVPTMAEALEQAQHVAARDRANEVMIGGGAQIYAEAMDYTDRIYLTQVALMPEGDTYFPALDWSIWKEAGTIEVPTGPKDSADFRVRVYRRKGPARR